MRQYNRDCAPRFNANTKFDVGSAFVTAQSFVKVSSTPDHIAKQDRRRVLLTFDDGPDLVTTPKLLNILARHDIKALFFMIGSQLEDKSRMAIARRAYHEGHYLGSHAYTHFDLRKLGEDDLRYQIRRTDELMGDMAHTLRFFRPPYGYTSPTLSRLLSQGGHTLVLWNVNSLDWWLGRARWVPFTLEMIRLCRRAVVLMHDDREGTVDDVEQLILGLKGMADTDVGLELCAELYGAAGAPGISPPRARSSYLRYLWRKKLSDFGLRARSG